MWLYCIIEWLSGKNWFVWCRYLCYTQTINCLTPLRLIATLHKSSSSLPTSVQCITFSCLYALDCRGLNLLLSIYVLIFVFIYLFFIYFVKRTVMVLDNNGISVNSATHGNFVPVVTMSHAFEDPVIADHFMHCWNCSKQLMAIAMNFFFFFIFYFLQKRSWEYDCDNYTIESIMVGW